VPFHILNQSEKFQETVPPGRRRAALAAVVAVVVYGVLTGLHRGSEEGWVAFADIGELLAAGTATIACAIRANRVRNAHARDREQSDASPCERTVSYSLLRSGSRGHC
jgi:hypothetical protein